MKTSVAGILLTTLLAASPLRAAPTTYAFDTVTAVQMDYSQPSITGLEKDTLANRTVAFVDMTNVSFQYVVTRCLPLFVTAMEKPGRYYLYITVDPAETNVQLRSCRLVVKT